MDVLPEDIPYEEDVAANKHSVNSWLRYLNHKQGAKPSVRNLIYERAVQSIPGSYKLWHRYLLERQQQLKGARLDDEQFVFLNNTFERALTYMHKYPVIWLEYLGFLESQLLVTQTRRLYDRSLQSLPITQHEQVWPLYIKFVKRVGVPETAIRIYRRYLKLEPTHVEDFIDYLVSVKQFDEAARQLATAINNVKFNSRKGKSKHELWMWLSELASQNPERVSSVKVEPMIRSGLQKFTNEVGKLWTALADYYIRLSMFDKARDIYEEGIASVVTVRDFSQIWDAYSEFEYGLIQSAMEKMAAVEEKGGALDDAQVQQFDMDYARYEVLIDRQPLLISNVLLRQNPHNVTEWLKRVKLFKDDLKQTVAEYTRAFQTVDPKQATGKLQNLWSSFAQFWEANKRLPEARKVFEKAILVEFQKVDALASVWAEYIEMELRNKHYDNALKLAKRATVVPANYKTVALSAPVQQRLFKSIRLWSLYADLEESFGTFFTTKAVYDQILNLRIASPLTVLSYANFLEENHYYEDSFKAYERGVKAFKFPHVMDIWVTYLRRFMARYGGTKLERLRDLFEQAVESAPAKFAPSLYLMYAEAEEEYGLARHAMLVYDRGMKACDPDVQPGFCNIYLRRATENFGVTRMRQIFEKAIALLQPKDVRDFALRYSRLEKNLGEIDRARAVLGHAAQFCPPQRDSDFWEEWRLFEVKHGSVDTVREMFRVKRSTNAQFSSSYANFTPASSAASGPPADSMQALEAGLEDDEDDEDLGVPTVEGPPEGAVAENEDAIDIDVSDDEASDAEMEMTIVRKAVPKAVFGSAADELENRNKEKALFE
eukprot:TRINITY_DN2456_c0_g1_i1.p1 TRINITY_DN2456_c0_g1~~TRINITY_DN2456_c0_g1_i1.p1  ORF type:complete len:829 (-),score=203.80 TRINITY_DN2456_c0_g1_i1:83-2569(-)